MKKIFFVFSFLIAAPLWAHPHVWIDVDVSPQTDSNGNITALHERWVFDPLYAQMLLESILVERDAATQEQLWVHLQDDIRENLGKEHYYTFPHQQFGEAQDGKLINENGELYFDVTVPLEEPAKTLQYQIYEPEYFVEILHSPDQSKTFDNGCTLNIVPADPDPEKYEQAAALDRNQKGEDNLGHYFAETGVITCP
ncbi:DUF1007 family protein [Cardiobacteriaceae bacterium TAE3-ERU3]|nr:DUF1007 family protein [Cardiobacteriaceae bacterium TAE3-ERU3]